MRVRESEYSPSETEAFTDTTDHGWTLPAPTIERRATPVSPGRLGHRDQVGERLRERARANVAGHAQDLAETPRIARVPPPVLVAVGGAFGLVLAASLGVGAWLLGFWVP